MVTLCTFFSDGRPTKAGKFFLISILHVTTPLFLDKSFLKPMSHCLTLQTRRCATSCRIRWCETGFRQNIIDEYIVKQAAGIWATVSLSERGVCVWVSVGWCGCIADHAARDGTSSDDHHAEYNVSSCHQPERIPVQSRVTVGRLIRVLRELAVCRIYPVITCTHVTRASGIAAEVKSP